VELILLSKGQKNEMSDPDIHWHISTTMEKEAWTKKTSRKTRRFLFTKPSTNKAEWNMD